MLEYSGSINAESSLSSWSFEMNLLFMFCVAEVSNALLSLRGEGEILDTRAQGKVNDDIMDDL